MINSSTHNKMSLRAAALRIGLLSASTVFFNIAFILWNDGRALTIPLSLAVSFAAWFSGIFCAIVALLPSVPHRAAWLILLSYLALGFQFAYLTELNYSPQTASLTDNEMISKYALEALKHGQNPYTWNFSDITRVYRNPGLLVTPFLDGAHQNRLTYPALPILLLWAFDLVGLGQIRIINLVFFVLLSILIFVGVRQKLRPVILLPLLLLGALNAGQDVVWCTLLVGMLLVWKRPVWRAVLFGLAISFHQQPWLAAPFLLITLWYEGSTLTQRLRRTALFFAVGIGLFVAINLPFMLSDFRAWTLGTLEPAYAAFNMYSQGLGILSVYGMVPLPREFYTILQFTFLAMAIFIHLRHPGPLFWVFPAIFFWLYYRSLENYWVFWIPLLLVALGRTVYVRVAPSNRWRGTAAVCLLMLTLPLLTGIYYVGTRPLITAHLIHPIQTSYGGSLISRLRVTVTNNDDHGFDPRFAIQHDGGGQALPWSVISGPESLNAGETAEYVIGNEGSYLDALPIDQGGQIVVSDANGSYVRRALVTVPASTSTASSDLIHNPDFGYWNDDGSLPINWTMSVSGSSNVAAESEEVEGHRALSLNFQNRLEMPETFLMHLTQRISFPGALSIWVHPALEMSPTSGEVYGLEFDDGFHRLWILFGSTESKMVVAPANHAVMYVLAPLNAWSRQTIDLAQLYQQLNWKLPAYSVRAGAVIDHPVRQIDLSLIASNNLTLESTWLFGAIEQDRDAMSLDHLVADTLANSDAYYVYVGNQYYLQRNYDQARQAYTRALTYDPTNAEAYFGIAQAKWNLRDFRDAIAAFGQAISFALQNLTQ